MQRTRSKPKRRHRGIGPAEIRFLQTGVVPEGSMLFRRGEAGTIDLRACRVAWLERRPRILYQWARQHPNMRPWGWWQFDSLEPRRLIAGIEHWQTGYDLSRLDERDRDRIIQDAGQSQDPSSVFAAAGIRQTFNFGIPHPEVLYADVTRPEYETEVAYFERLDLLLEGESHAAS